MLVFHALFGDIAEDTFDDGRPISQAVWQMRESKEESF